MTRKNRSGPEVAALIGIGLDNNDGHRRFTTCDDIVVVGGSEDTHAKMQDIVIHLNESLRGRGKRLREASSEEVADLLQRAMENRS